MIELPFILNNNLKFVEGKNDFFFLRYSLFRPLFALWIVPPGAAAALSPI
jgi:hypothetical protein